MSRVYDDTVCSLGEGPLWHPTRGQLYWFDIHGSTLHTNENGAHRSWSFDENVSAAGWTDDTHLMIASETRLFRFDVETGASEDICGLEADNPDTRSNDGRADPWGGFWIGTMGKAAEPGAGGLDGGPDGAVGDRVAFDQGLVHPGGVVDPAGHLGLLSLLLELVSVGAGVVAGTDALRHVAGVPVR